MKTQKPHILIRDSRILPATLHKRTKRCIFPPFLINIIVIIKDGCSYYAAMHSFFLIAHENMELAKEKRERKNATWNSVEDKSSEKKKTSRWKKEYMFIHNKIGNVRAPVFFRRHPRCRWVQFLFSISAATYLWLKTRNLATSMPKTTKRNNEKKEWNI